MPTLRNKTADDRYIPALRLSIPAGESTEIADVDAPGFADQTDTWELLPAQPAARPQSTPAGKE